MFKWSDWGFGTKLEWVRWSGTRREGRHLKGQLRTSKLLPSYHQQPSNCKGEAEKQLGSASLRLKVKSKGAFMHPKAEG